MGFLAGLKGFTAAVVGGIGSIPGAMLGGLLVGLRRVVRAGLRRRQLVRPDRVRDPDRLHARAADGPARHARDPEGLMCPTIPPITDAAGRADDRRRRVGRAAEERRERAARRPRARARRVRADAAAVPPRRLRGRRLRRCPLFIELGEHLPLRLHHAHLRAARARAERRRRLRGPARPRLHRLLRLRRLRVRASLAPTSTASTGPPGDDPDRDRRGGACSGCSSAAVAPAARRLPRDRHAVLRPGVRHVRQQREPVDSADGLARAARTGSATSTRSASSATRSTTTRQYYYFIARARSSS